MNFSENLNFKVEKILKGNLDPILSSSTPINVLPLHLKQTFPPIIFMKGEGDGLNPGYLLKSFLLYLLVLLNVSDATFLISQSFSRIVPAKFFDQFPGPSRDIPGEINCIYSLQNDVVSFHGISACEGKNSGLEIINQSNLVTNKHS